MVTPAHCNCGWRAELSAHYQGRRIRCPNCDCVLDLPGQPQSPLYGTGWSAPSGRRTTGQWVTVCGASDRQCARNGSGVGLVLFFALIAVFSVVRQCKDMREEERTRPRAAPSEKTPSPASPKEDEF